MSNFEKIIITLIGILVLIAIIFGVVIFRQQKVLNALKGETGAVSSQTSSQKNRHTLANIIKQFSGTVENISGNQITVNVSLTDFSKPKDPEKLKNAGEPVNLTADDFGTLNKKITVNTNEKTIFATKKLAELKVGDAVNITSDKSPYSADTVTAETITSVKSK